MMEEFKHENKHYLMDCKVVYNCLKISFDFGKFRASDLKRIVRERFIISSDKFFVLWQTRYC